MVSEKKDTDYTGTLSSRSSVRQLGRNHKLEVLINAYQNEIAVLSKIRMDFKASLISHQDFPHVF